MLRTMLSLAERMKLTKKDVLRAQWNEAGRKLDLETSLAKFLPNHTTYQMINPGEVA